MNAVKLLAIVAFLAVVLTAGSTANIHGNAYGDPKAPVTIEVFSDFQCPACKAFHDAEFQRIMADYVTPGKVYFIYRYFPLQGHPYGRICAEYVAAAARVDRYQKVAEAIFAQQEAISKSGNVQAVVESVLTPSEAKAVQSVLKSPEVQQEIETDLAEGRAIPVPSTPTLLVTTHGRSQPVTGQLNYTLFKQYIDGLLAK